MWYPAEIRNWSFQVAVPKASDKAKKKPIRTYGPMNLTLGSFLLTELNILFETRNFVKQNKVENIRNDNVVSSK